MSLELKLNSKGHLITKDIEIQDATFTKKGRSSPSYKYYFPPFYCFTFLYPSQATFAFSPITVCLAFIFSLVTIANTQPRIEEYCICLEKKFPRVHLTIWTGYGPPCHETQLVPMGHADLILSLNSGNNYLGIRRTTQLHMNVSSSFVVQKRKPCLFYFFKARPLTSCHNIKETNFPWKPRKKASFLIGPSININFLWYTCSTQYYYVVWIILSFYFIRSFSGLLSSFWPQETRLCSSPIE